MKKYSKQSINLQEYERNETNEDQLRAAANKIEEAAAKLAKLKPRPKENNQDTNELTFDEVILEAVRSIVVATKALIKSATVAQKELLIQDRNEGNTKKVYCEGQWTDGLISAAQEVAKSVVILCQAANETVQGNSSPEKLKSAAQVVYADTTTLVIACQTKTDSDSEILKGLRQETTQVKEATKKLVNKVQEFLDKEKDLEGQHSNDSINTMMSEGGGVEDKLKIIRLKEEISKAEKLLEDKRSQLKRISQEKYERN